ncbi:MAG: hypothetical protein APF80_13055 [Alphaproteobacteria bacterium BRH_c36]|nr:MAG: hypothetical protein APF80_13055 [Alphaproteobacteria bacterium BRH_c36]
MARMAANSSISPERPVLELSGPKLRIAFETLVNASEAVGGIEQFVAAVKLKSKVFQDLLGEGKADTVVRAEFEQLVQLMATVRRRLKRLVDDQGWPKVREAIAALIEDAADTANADKTVAAFVKTFPDVREYRFTRDLAAEILHNAMPEHYPLMQRWVWDTKTNSGVIREIWHGDDVDHMVIDIADGYETFLVLREELSQFLSDNGVFRDMLWHVDLLCAQVYGDYINAQGGAWLKTEFGSDSDPLEHTRRIIGLDRVAGKRPGKSGTIDGTAETVLPTKLLS